jgi:hypothetical protein
LRWVTDDGSRWRGPGESHGFHAAVKNGSAASEPRSRCASLHHGRVSAPTEYKDVARVFVHTTRGLPSNIVIRPQQVCRRARSRQGSRPVRVALKRQSLTAPARAGSSIRVGRGEEMDLPKSNKEIWDSIQMKRRVPLDKNNPIQGFRMPAFGCRPIATRRHTLGPASEILHRSGRGPLIVAIGRFRVWMRIIEPCHRENILRS